MPTQRKGLIDRIRHFTPSWFAVNMGTGIIGLLINSLPYGDKGPRDIVAFIILIINVSLFAGFNIASAARYIMFPQIWTLMIREPVQSLFLSCYPMALSTIISATVSLSQYRISSMAWLDLLWSLWWIDSALAAGSAVLLPYIMITRHSHSLEQQSAAWLLPVVPPIVSASCGGVLAGSFIDVSAQGKAQVTVAVSCLLVAAGLALSIMLSATYVLRLIAHGFPKAGLVVSVFLPLGPCGQGGFALLVLSQHFATLISASGIDDADTYGKMAVTISTAGSLALWSVGLWFALISGIGLLEISLRSSIPFKVNFWGMIFPWGVYSLLTLQLGKVLNLTIFHILGILFSASTALMWTIITSKTVRLAYEGSIFYAPCLDDAPLIAQSLDPSPQVTELSRFGTSAEGNGDAMH